MDRIPISVIEQASRGAMKSSLHAAMMASALAMLAADKDEESHCSSGTGGVDITASAMAETLTRVRSLQSRTSTISEGAAGSPPSAGLSGGGRLS